MALSTDGKGRFGRLDPYLGAAHAVAEAARNVAVTGARPLAITNCMNFGNPERPEVMWQFAESIRGMRDACLALEHARHRRQRELLQRVRRLRDLAHARHRHARPARGPPPARAGRRSAGRAWRSTCSARPSRSSAGPSSPTCCSGSNGGRPPALDLARERELHEVLLAAAREDLLASAHDCSEGGLAVALAESAIAGAHGFAVTVPGDLPAHVALFSESASRAVVSVVAERADELVDLAGRHGIACTALGETGGPRVVFAGLFETTVEELRDVYEGAIPRLLGEPA